MIYDSGDCGGTGTGIRAGGADVPVDVPRHHLDILGRQWEGPTEAYEPDDEAGERLSHKVLPTQLLPRTRNLTKIAERHCEVKQYLVPGWPLYGQNQPKGRPLTALTLDLYATAVRVHYDLMHNRQPESCPAGL